MMKKILSFILLGVLLLSALAVAEESDITASGYVLVYTNTDARWFPLPDDENGQYSFTVRQTMDGTEVHNTITVTPEGVYMEESDCDNQNCVGEGMVTLENKDTRILANMIICLPHSLTIELYSKEEVIEMLQAAKAAQAEQSEKSTTEQTEESGSEAAK